MTERQHILIVEDHHDIRQMMGLVLERAGYEISTASSAHDALEILEDHDIHLLVLDLMMPVISGWDVLAIRAANPRLQQIPTIVVTATWGLSRAEVQRFGVFDVLIKPFVPEKLEALAASALRSVRSNPD